MDLGDTSIDDTLLFNIELSNIGIDDLTINEVYSTNGNIEVLTTFPLSISGMSKIDLPLSFIPNQLGIVEDTIVINSNDPINPIKKIPFTVNVENYFVIIDNDDAGSYSETGSWFTSVAQAYGPTSRYAYIQTTSNGPSATFNFSLNRSGFYDVFEIIPQTVNSADNALYNILIGNRVVASMYLNQNNGSGNWKNIGRFYLPADSSISIKVIDNGQSTSGPVIRADAFKVLLYEESPDNIDDNNAVPLNEYRLLQNYPNPFNPGTIINYNLPVSGKVIIRIFDILGNEIETLVNEEKPAGRYSIVFDATSIAGGLPSGVYFYRLQAGSFVETKKMVFIK